MWSAEGLYQLLDTQVVTITFTKKDGSERVMKATTSLDFRPETTGSSVPREGILTVWDVEANGWRSIIIASILRVQYGMG